MRKRFIWIVFISFFLNAKWLYAETEPMHLTVPVNPFAPWVIERENVISGIDVEIIELLAQKVGFSYSLQSCPFARCLKMLEQGEADIMLGLFISKERSDFLHFIQPGYLQDAPKTFYLQANDDREINQYEDLLPLKIGVVRATRYFPQFDTDQRLNKIEVSRDIQLLKMLEMGRIDTFVGTPSHIDLLLSEASSNIPFRKAKYQDTEEAFSHLAIAKNSIAMQHQDSFRQALTDLIKEGKINQIVKRFSVTDSQIPQADLIKVKQASLRNPENPEG